MKDENTYYFALCTERRGALWRNGDHGYCDNLEAARLFSHREVLAKQAKDPYAEWTILDDDNYLELLEKEGDKIIAVSIPFISFIYDYRDRKKYIPPHL